MAILIDLDQTLIDSHRADSLRRARQWNQVYAIIPQLLPYPGITCLLKELRDSQIPVCIVTSSPEPYCRRVIKHWKWDINATVCYHDTQQRKPYPAPMLLGLNKLGISAKDAVAIGDAAKDTQAARATGIFSIGALWGTLEHQQLLSSKPDLLCNTVSDLKGFLSERFA